ncbi:MAG: phage terminase large subunit [Pyrinomonadaceae bacterium]
MPAKRNPTSPRRRKKLDFSQWLAATSPATWRFDFAHHMHLCEQLKRVTSGECKRLMIFMPPRHGKSEMVTVRYTAWRIEMEPGLNVILGSYNQKLANRFSRKVRRIVEERVTMSKDRRAVDEWETSAGGGVRAVGVGAGVTGFGASLIMIDDPIKSRAEAESPVRRDNAWNWFSDDIYTRLEPDAAVVLIQTRWHEDDLAGRLIEAAKDGGDEWEIVNLPAIAEAGNAAGNAGTLACKTRQRLSTPGIPHDEGVGTDGPHSDLGGTGVAGKGACVPAGGTGVAGKGACVPTGDPLGRSPGEALWPERFSVGRLARIRRQLGSYSFSALYQQRPVPVEGAIFRRIWLKQIIDRAPTGLRWARGYDLAVSLRTTADYTASVRCAFDSDGNLYIADGFRRRIDYSAQRRFILEQMRTEPDVIHGIEEALHGAALVQDLRRESRTFGVAFRSVRVDADKLTRALVWSALAEEGRVHLVQGGWIDEFVAEACSFPAGRHDDQIDAVSLAVQMLKKTGGRAHGF